MFCFLLNAALIVVQEFAETLEMYNFTRPQEFDHLVDVRVVRKAKYIVISRASLLLRRHVLDDIGDRIGLHREISRAEWYSRRIDRVNSVCMPCVVIAVPILIEALCPFSVGQLSYYAADYLKMPQLLCADRGSPRATSTKKPCAARVTGRKREGKRECAKCRLALFL